MGEDAQVLVYVGGGAHSLRVGAFCRKLIDFAHVSTIVSPHNKIYSYKLNIYIYGQTLVFIYQYSESTKIVRITF